MSTLKLNNLKAI